MPRPACSNVRAAAFSPFNNNHSLPSPREPVGHSRGWPRVLAWFWQRTSLPSQQQIGGFDLSAPLDVFRKLTAFPRSHNCFYHTTTFWTSWPFTSWHHLYLQANLRFGSHHIILPTLPQDLLRLREWHHCDLTGVIMGKQFFLDASERGGDVMPSLFNPWHSCSVTGSFILADTEVTALPGSQENNLRRSRHLWNPGFAVYPPNSPIHVLLGRFFFSSWGVFHVMRLAGSCSISSMFNSLF